MEDEMSAVKSHSRDIHGECFTLQKMLEEAADR